MGARAWVVGIAGVTVLTIRSFGWDWPQAVAAGLVVTAAGELLGVAARRWARAPAPPLPAAAAAGSHKPLTPSEAEVAKLVARGLTNREIAQRTFRTEKTIDTHVQHAFDKLDIHSRVELANWVRSRRLDDPEDEKDEK